METTQIFAEMLLLLHRAESSEWEEINPVLEKGEPAIVTDAADIRHMLKIGDGEKAWTELPFLPGDLSSDMITAALEGVSVELQQFLDLLLDRTENLEAFKKEMLDKLASGELIGPQGPKGDKGEPGEQGAAGKDGTDGAPGKDGYTPQKGVDYFTEADKTEMVAEVLANFTDVSEVGQ